MSEFALEGPELKKMVKLARKNPLPFAFNPGKDVKEHYFALHRKRPAKALGKAAKSEGAGKRAAFGTCFVDGKVMQLTCDVVVPTMAKSLKKFLKANKVTLNIEIMDADGNMVESDIEDLPDDPSLYDDDMQPAPEQEPQPEPTGGLSAEDIVARIKAAQAALAAAPKPIVEKLVPALKQAAGHLKAQELEAADSMLDRIEAALTKVQESQPTPAPMPENALADRLETIRAKIEAVGGPTAEKLMTAFSKVDTALKAGKTDVATKGADQLESALAKVSAPKEPETAPPPPEAPPPPDPQMLKLAQLVQNFKSQAGLLESRDAASEILRALAAVGVAIKAGDKTSATAQLTTIRAQLEAAKAAQAKAKETAEEAPEDQDGPPPGLIEWMRKQAQVEPRVNQALSEGLVEDVSLLRRNWSTIQDKVEQGDYEGAEADLPAIVAMLDAGRRDEGTAHLADVAEDVRPFAISSINWKKTRTKMLSEVEKLETIIRATMGDDEDFDMNGSLTQHLTNLDESLSDALDAVVNAPEGPDRVRARDSARGVLDQFQAALNDDFFADIDNNSGFGSVAVAGTARKALGEIKKALA
ncbi:MAG: hypothetical protein AB3N23_19460 [Paracoccaceae bacterium]